LQKQTIFGRTDDLRTSQFTLKINIKLSDTPQGDPFDRSSVTEQSSKTQSKSKKHAAEAIPGYTLCTRGRKPFIYINRIK